MRILLVASWYPSADSPVRGLFIRDQVEVLSRRHDVRVFVPDMRSLRSSPPSSPARIEEFLRTPRDRVTRLDLWGGQRFLRRFFAPLHRRAARRALGHVVRSHGRPDLIHAHVSWPGGWLALDAGRELGIPVILTEHSGPFSSLLRSGFMRNAVHAALTGAAKVLAVSPALREQMLAFLPDLDVGIVGNVVRTDLITPAEAPCGSGERRRFLAAGALLPSKGLDYFLNACAIMKKRGADDFDVTIAGDGPDSRRLRRLARETGVAANVRFTGMLSRPDLVAEYRSCDAFVLPSLGETFGVVAVEAMACGKPVIATRCGGPEYTVTPDTGVLVEPADPEALASAMERFLSGAVRFDPGRVRESVEARFGPDAFIEKMERIYESAAGGIPRAGIS